MRKIAPALILCIGLPLAVASLAAKAGADQAADMCYRLSTTNRCQQAIPVCTQAINTCRNRATAASSLVNRGSCHSELGNNQAALDDYTRAIQLNPGSSTAFSNRCAVYNERKQYQKALADCNRALAIKPDNATTYSYRGFTFHHLGRFQESAADHSRAIQLEPNDAQHWYNRATAYYSLKQYQNAINDLYQSVRLSPQNGHYYFARAMCWKNLGKFEWAAWDFGQAIKLNPKQLAAYYNRALSFEKLGKLQQALADIEHLLRFDPNHRKAQAIRARLQQALAGGNQPASPARPHQPPAPANPGGPGTALLKPAAGVRAGWRFSVARSIDVQGQVMVNGQSAPLVSSQQIKGSLLVEKVRNGVMTQGLYSLRQAMASEGDPSSGQDKRTDFLRGAPRQARVSRFGENKSVVWAGNGAPVAAETLQEMLSWPVPLRFLPSNGFRLGQRLSPGSQYLASLLSFMRVSGGSMQIQAVKVEKDRQTGFAMVHFAGPIRVSLALDDMPSQLDGQVRLVVALELGYPIFLKIEGNLSGRGVKPDGQGGQAHYTFQGRGSLSQSMQLDPAQAQAALGQQQPGGNPGGPGNMPGGSPGLPGQEPPPLQQ